MTAIEGTRVMVMFGGRSKCSSTRSPRFNPDLKIWGVGGGVTMGEGDFDGNIYIYINDFDVPTSQIRNSNIIALSFQLDSLLSIICSKKFGGKGENISTWERNFPPEPSLDKP